MSTLYAAIAEGLRVWEATSTRNDLSQPEHRSRIAEHLAEWLTEDGWLTAEGKSSRPAADATPPTARCPVCRRTFEACTCGGGE